MIHFCTLFDSHYLSRGLAMYRSMVNTGAEFHLYVFAFDDKAVQMLRAMNKPNITVITLKEFENADLLRVKPGRSRAEYCWTCTPATIEYVLNTFKTDNCTYIDSDLFFYRSPQILFDEMGDASVLITEHRYTPKYDRTEIAGKYCVQFITFKNNTEGRTVLSWWYKSCLDWCYDRYEDGKFGDQKYLDDWTTRFKGVHVLQHLGGGLAPWNIQQYVLQNTNTVVPVLKEINSGKSFDAVFYHFHFVRFYLNDLLDLGWFKLSSEMVNGIYKPYVLELGKSLLEIRSTHPDFKESLRPFSLQDADGMKEKLKFLFKLVFRYNLFAHAQFIKK